MPQILFRYPPYPRIGLNPCNSLSLATLRFELSWHHKRMTWQISCKISNIALLILREIL